MAWLSKWRINLGTREKFEKIKKFNRSIPESKSIKKTKKKKTKNIFWELSRVGLTYNWVHLWAIRSNTEQYGAIGQSEGFIQSKQSKMKFLPLVRCNVPILSVWMSLLILLLVSFVFLSVYVCVAFLFVNYVYSKGGGVQGVINGQTMSYDTLPCDSNCTHCST